MKKILKMFYLVVLGLILVLTNNVSALNKDFYDYYLDSFHVDIVVNEDNTLEITEKIGAYFKVDKHGIIRKIPIKNQINRLDGTKSENRAKINNIYVNDKFSVSKDGNYKIIKIGDENKYISGKKDYLISYTYDLGKDTGKGYDELYFNIIGNKWDTYIENVTFKITMPKNFDESKLGFSVGKTGSISSDYVNYNVEGNVISGMVNKTLDAYDGLTVRLELPDGYFTGSNVNDNILTCVMIFVPILGLIIGFLLWLKYGKDDMVVETVEFYPPEKFNSLEIAYLYKGKVENNDVTSLLVYLANKGYLKISEEEVQGIFFKSKDFKITKLKEYDGDNLTERIFFNGLFASGNEVRSDNLYNKFYKVVNRIKKEISNKKNKNLIFIKNFINMRIPVSIFMFIIYLVIIGIPIYGYSGFNDAISVITFALFYIPFYVFGVAVKMKIPARIFFFGFMIVHSTLAFSSFSFIDALLSNYYYLIGFVLGIISLVVLMIIFKYMPKRTRYGTDMLGKILGFKNFLEKAEKDKLEALVMENPSYFYDILPYTYVLGVSSKWINKFESISLQAPDWYDTNDSFSVSSFGNFMNTTMKSANSAMTSAPLRSSGGSSGGGSSGGGSGGGGGSSW